MLDLAAIERAISSVESVSRTETSVDVGDLKVWLRPLSGHEEVDVLEYAMAALADGQTTKVDMVEFYFRSQVRTLAHGIVRVGDIDLRGDMVETGEEVDGVRVKRSKVDVVVEFIEKHWSKLVVQKMFVCTVNALEAATTKTVEKIRSNPFDHDAEIERLQSRIKELEIARDQLKSSQQHDAWVSSLKNSSMDYAKAAEEPAPTPSPEEQPQAPSPSPPPPPPPPPQQPSGRAPSFPVGVREAPLPARPGAENSAIPNPAEHSSFLDEGDPEASIEAETRRQIEIRKRGQMESLRQARNTQQVVLDPKGSTLDVSSPKTGWGQGVPQGVVMSTDGPIEVSERTVQGQPQQLTLNTPPQSTRRSNPRFR